jgi:hypothetical protein
VLAIAGLTWALFTRAFLNYDTLYMLIWGRDLVEGRTPDYDVPLAPTPHPLAEAVGGVLSLFGTDAGYTLMLALAMLSFGALVWGIFRLGEACFSWPVGMLAAFVVATREPILSRAVRAYVDIPFLALVVAAAVLEVRRPRCGWPVLVLLGLAGLLRPEAWLLAAAYWLYLAPERDTAGRLRDLALVVAAPLIWALSDLAISGDLLHSLTSTRDTAETLGRPKGIENVPEVMPRRLGEILRWVPLIGGTIGFFLALRLEPRRARVPAALAVLGGVAFIAIGLAGLSLLGRYLFLPAAMLAIFFGFAALGWIGRPPIGWHRWWVAGAAVLMVAFVGSTAGHQIDKLDTMREGIRLRGGIEDDLRDLTRLPAAKPVLETCTPVYVPNHRPVPILAWYLERDPRDFVSAQLVRPASGAFVAPAGPLVSEKFILDPRDPGRLLPVVPTGFKPVRSNSSWLLYELGCR